MKIDKAMLQTHKRMCEAACPLRFDDSLCTCQVSRGLMFALLGLLDDGTCETCTAVEPLGDETVVVCASKTAPCRGQEVPVWWGCTEWEGK